jgi:calcineurin-like phosphoesterase family protein
MNEALVARWNAVVGKNDVVFHLGDFCLGNKEQTRGWLKRLNGRVHLVMGNHDRYEPREYVELGFVWVYKYPICYRNFFWLSHEPMFLPVNSPSVNIAGHTHTNDYTDGLHYFNACVEKTNYTPVLFDDVMKILEKRLVASERGYKLKNEKRGN